MYSYKFYLDELSQVYLAAIAGYVPLAMVQAIAAFMECCTPKYYLYLSTWTISQLCWSFPWSMWHIYFCWCSSLYFTSSSTCTLPLLSIHPALWIAKWLYSSITESKHIKAVKEPWWHLSRYKALKQMLCTILQMEKLVALHQIFKAWGMMRGKTTSYMAKVAQWEETDVLAASDVEGDDSDSHDNKYEEDSGRPIDDVASNSLSDIREASRICVYLNLMNYIDLKYLFFCILLEFGYPKSLELLAVHIGQTQVPLIFYWFLHQVDHPDSKDVPSHLEDCLPFFRKIHIYVSLSHGNFLLSQWSMWSRGHAPWTYLLQPILQRLAKIWYCLEFGHHHALDSFNSFFVNHYVDHHTHEFLTG